MKKIVSLISTTLTLHIKQIEDEIKERKICDKKLMHWIRRMLRWIVLHIKSDNIFMV